MGDLTRTCVRNWDSATAAAAATTWRDWVEDEGNRHGDSDSSFPVCGNATGARKCPEGYFCLEVRGTIQDRNQFTN